ncbi:MAG TPA: hypothetical protein PLT92_13150 [Ignavibacteriaceae bacterium]|jgi:long-subunit fatty acid transport protein|nr:hypothetical protein [Ignavibacteriaceae bacterium]HOJ19502.1 hypothetical protein [Ignavibacteriaceae bacterium]HPO56294.1 hypothetical protein [Ignavibacteriaceae bacterium]
MFPLKIFSKTAIIIIFISTLAAAQGITDALRVSEPGLGIGARALGMGNAYNSTSDDASAMYFNPAGLGLIKKLEFMGGLEYYKFNNDATLFNNTEKYSSSSTRLNQLAFAFPFPTVRGSLVFGLAYNGAKNLTNSMSFDGYNPGNHSMIKELEGSEIPYWLYLTDTLGNVSQISGKLNQSGTVIQTGSVNNWVLSGAMEVYPNLFVGMNLGIISGEYKYTRDYYEDDYLGNYAGVELSPGEPDTRGFQTFNMNSIIKWDISGWDLKVGMLYQLKKYGRFGLTIQFPKTYSINEEFLVDAFSQFNTPLGRVDLPGDIADDLSDKVEYDIYSPYVLTGSGAVNYMGFIASAEASLIDYTQMEYANAKGISEKTISDMNMDIANNLRAVVNLNFGLEYTFAELGLRLRAGFIMQPSAYKDDPSDFDKKYLTGGMGLLIDQAVSIDVAYAHGLWKDMGDNYGTNLSRTFQSITTDKLLLSFAYRF